LKLFVLGYFTKKVVNDEHFRRFVCSATLFLLPLLCTHEMPLQLVLQTSRYMLGEVHAQHRIKQNWLNTVVPKPYRLVHHFHISYSVLVPPTFRKLQN